MHKNRCQVPGARGQGLKFKKIIFIFFFIFTHYSLLTTHYSLAQEPSKEDEAIFVAKKAFADGFYEVSLGLLERFTKNYPDSPKIAEANLLIGQCLFRKNEYLDALAKFEELLNQAAAKDIKDGALYWIAEVHFKGNSYSKAGQYYKMIIDDFPNSAYLAYAYYSLGWCLFQEAKFDESLRYFKIAEEKFPKEIQGQESSFKIIECLYNLKDYASLKEKAKSYLKLYPKEAAKSAYLYFYMAEADYYLGNLNEAKEQYSKTILNTSDEKLKALAMLGIGWSHLKSKHYAEAQGVFLEVEPFALEKKNKDALLLARAILAFETKLFGEAKALYDELINAAPESEILIQAYLGKADTLYQMAEYKGAISTYKEALLATSSKVVSQEAVDKLHYGLAWSFLKEGEFKEAIEEFQKIVSETQDKTVKVAALCQIGDAYQDSGDYKSAQSAYDKILKDYPDSFYSDYVQYQLGLTLLKVSNYDGAIIAFRGLKNNFPNSKLVDDASYALALSYFQREDYNSSLEIFENFQAEFKESNLRPQALYLLGTSLYNLGKFSEAIDAFKDVIKQYSQDTELVQKAEYEIADCYHQLGNEKEAMVRFNVLRAKYPDSRLTPEVIWWLGDYYFRQNDLNLARRYFSSLIQDFPKSNLVPDAYYVLGSIGSDEGKYQEAIDNFKKVVELGKSDLTAQAQVAIADIFVKQEKADLALATYKDVVKEYPNLAHLIYPKVADIYRKLGDLGQAMDFYRQSLKVVPVRQMPNIQFMIGEISQAQGRQDEAIEEYLKVTYLYPEKNDLTVKSLLRVAEIYEDKNNLKEALSIYKRVIAIGTEEAKYAQERINWIKAHIK